MSDDRIIDFNELKNKVKDSDVDKFEQYIYNLYFSVMDGKMSMAEFSRKIFDYMRDNNISQEKFMKIQKQFMERYGMDTEEVEKQLRNFGIDPSTAGFMRMKKKILRKSIMATLSRWQTSMGVLLFNRLILV